MKKERRWMKSAIDAAQECQTVMPFQRGGKRKPASLKEDTTPRRSIAAR
jgi:hypothetical protein